jgi:ATP-dependent RNA helicase DDX10/DBP4
MESGAAVATLGAQSDDGGYISPEFDLPDLPTDEEEEMAAAPPSKKTKFGSFSSKPGNKSAHKYLLDEEEELALRLLGRS